MINFKEFFVFVDESLSVLSCIGQGGPFDSTAFTPGESLSHFFDGAIRPSELKFLESIIEQIAKSGHEQVKLADSSLLVDIYPVIDMYLLLIRDLHSERVQNRQAALSLNNIMNYLPGFVYWKDENFVYLGCNDNFAKAAGLNNHEQIVGKTDFDLAWGQSEAELFRESDRAVLAGNEKHNFEEPQLQADGKHATVLATKVPLKSIDEQIVGVLGIYTDITERKLQEEALRIAKDDAEKASRAKSEFLANMSHDIRTPLSSLVALSDLFENKTIDNLELNDFAHDMSVCANELMRLVNGILEATEYDRGLIRAQDEPFNLRDVAGRVLNLVRLPAKRKGLNLVMAYDSSTPDCYIGKHLLLHRVILNLLGNAIKFTEEGDVQLIITSKRLDEQKELVTIKVIDTGVGFKQEDSQRIFQEFERLQPSYEGKKQGSGLGLHIVKQFIGVMNGDISVQSEVGKGSTFTAEITLERVEDKKVLGPSSKSNDGSLVESTCSQHDARKSATTSAVDVSNPSGTFRALLVEDTEIAKKVSCLVLDNLDCQTLAVDTGEAAVAAVKNRQYDIIFMDIGLPGISGIEATRRIRDWEIEQGLRHVPIVVLTAHASSKVEQEALEAGAVEVRAKPLGAALAKRLLDQWVTKSIDKAKPDVIDLNQAASLLGGREQAEELLRMFVEDMPQRMQKAQAAYDNEDFAAMEDVVHGLHGEASYIGVPFLKQACLELETALGMNTKNDQIKPYYEKFKKSAEDVLDAYSSCQS